MKWFFWLVVYLFMSVHTGAQQQNIDSLKQELTVAKRDTTQFKVLTALYSNYLNSYPDSAFPYAQKAYELSKEINFDAGIRYSLGDMSGIAQSLNNYKQA